MYRTILHRAVAIAALFSTIDLASASEPSSNGWQFRYTPYAWVTSIKGTRAIRGVEVETDASFLDIVENSDSLVALMAYSEARKGKLAFYLDTIWAKLSASGNAVRGRNFGALGITLAGEAKIKYEYAVVGAGMNYEVARWTHGDSLKDGQYTGGSTALDLALGGRLWYQKYELDIRVTGTSSLPSGFTREGSLIRSGSVSETWFDPVIGARLRHDLGGGQEIILLGDVGGFGVGSDFTWQALGAYTFEFAKRGNVTFAGAIGYRAMYADYSNGSGSDLYVYDELQHGPVLGLSMRF